MEEINLRDKRDVTRADSPLSIAKDAIVVETSDISSEEVFEKMLRIVIENSGRASHNLT